MKFVGKIGGFTAILPGFRDDIGEMESDAKSANAAWIFWFRDDIGEMERLGVKGSPQHGLFREDIGEMERNSTFMVGHHNHCFATILVKWKALPVAVTLALFRDDIGEMESCRRKHSPSCDKR
jgi:hypothetical protein